MVLLLMLLTASLNLAFGLQCDSPGDLFAHETDCSSYYRCGNDNSPHLFTCPEGQYYSRELQICDDNVVCIPSADYVASEDNVEATDFQDDSSITDDLGKVIQNLDKKYSNPEKNTAEESKPLEAREYLPVEYSKRVEKRQIYDEKETEKEGDNLEVSANKENKREDNNKQEVGNDEDFESHGELSDTKVTSSEQENDSDELGKSITKVEPERIENKTETQTGNDETAGNHEEGGQENTASIEKEDGKNSNGSEHENVSGETTLSSEFKSNSGQSEEIFHKDPFFDPIRYSGFVPLSQDQQSKSSSLIHGYDEVGKDHDSNEKDELNDNQEKHKIDEHEIPGEERSHELKDHEKAGEQNDKPQAEEIITNDGNYGVDEKEQNQSDTLENGDKEIEKLGEDREVTKDDDLKAVETQQDKNIKDEGKEEKDVITDTNNPIDKPEEIPNDEGKTKDEHIDEGTLNSKIIEESRSNNTETISGVETENIQTTL